MKEQDAIRERLPKLRGRMSVENSILGTVISICGDSRERRRLGLWEEVKGQ